MNKRHRKKLIISLVVLFTAWIAFELYRAGDENVPSPLANAPVVFDQGKANGERIRTHSWSVSYRRIISTPDQTVLDLEDVHDGVIYKKGKPYLRMRATHVSVNTITHDFNTTGHLHVETVGPGRTRAFDTSSAIWSEASQRLTLSHDVQITTGQAIMHVGSLSFDVKQGDIHLSGVRGDVQP